MIYKTERPHRSQRWGQKGTAMTFKIRRAKGRVTIRIHIGDVTITLDLPL
jgi:hypothetical protein